MTMNRFCILTATLITVLVSTCACGGDKPEPQPEFKRYNSGLAIQSNLINSKIPVTVLYDTNQDMMRTLNISSIPHVFVYDKNGKQVYSHTGYIPGDEEALLQKLLQAK